ncbi:MAG: hypothetical protein EA401_10465 [Planctomycetota bacterium]|nr:MAG: hypothetical protein EA401_10465 [Planctomycetota bacterium]
MQQYLAVACILALLTPVFPCADLCRSAWNAWQSQGSPAMHDADTCQTCCTRSCPPPAPSPEGCGTSCVSSDIQHPTITPSSTSGDVALASGAWQSVKRLGIPRQGPQPAWSSWQKTPHQLRPHCLLI